MVRGPPLKSDSIFGINGHKKKMKECSEKGGTQITFICSLFTMLGFLEEKKMAESNSGGNERDWQGGEFQPHLQEKSNHQVDWGQGPFGFFVWCDKEVLTWAFGICPCVLHLYYFFFPFEALWKERARDLGWISIEWETYLSMIKVSVPQFATT